MNIDDLIAALVAARDQYTGPYKAVYLKDSEDDYREIVSVVVEKDGIVLMEKRPPTIAEFAEMYRQGL